MDWSRIFFQTRLEKVNQSKLLYYYQAFIFSAFGNLIITAWKSCHFLLAATNLIKGEIRFPVIYIGLPIAPDTKPKFL